MSVGRNPAVNKVSYQQNQKSKKLPHLKPKNRSCYSHWDCDWMNGEYCDEWSDCWDCEEYCCEEEDSIDDVCPCDCTAGSCGDCVDLNIGDWCDVQAIWVETPWMEEPDWWEPYYCSGACDCTLKCIPYDCLNSWTGDGVCDYGQTVCWPGNDPNGDEWWIPHGVALNCDYYDNDGGDCNPWNQSCGSHDDCPDEWWCNTDGGCMPCGYGVMYFDNNIQDTGMMAQMCCDANQDWPWEDVVGSPVGNYCPCSDWGYYCQMSWNDESNCLCDCDFSGDCAPASCEDLGLWDCGDGQCIPNSYVCDGSSEFCNADWPADCANGADEGLENCGYADECAADPTCADDQYTCSDGACIPDYWECDNWCDCAGCEDEADCGGCPGLGDLNGDGSWNVLDIVQLANCVLAQNCSTIENACAGDMNGDGSYNVLDIVTLANCVLVQNCGG